MFGWHTRFRNEFVVPMVPYNPRNIDKPLDIQYRGKDRIEEHGKDVQLRESTLEETYDHRRQVE